MPYLLKIQVLIIFQDSHIVRLVCDDPKQQEELTKELERDEDGQQCFLADPGWAKIEITTFFRTGFSIPLVIVTVDKNLFG